LTELRGLFQFYAIGLWQRRWSIVLVAWVVCVAGWLVVASLPDRFEGRARILVDTDTILGPLMEGLAVSADVAGRVEVMRQTLLSRPNLEELVRLTDLDLEVDTERGYEALIESLTEKIKVSMEGRDLFRVAYTSTDPQQAYRVVDAVLQIFVEQNVGNSQRDVELAREFIDRQIADYEAKLREAELAVADFRRQHASALAGSDSSQRRLEAAQADLRQLRSTLESTLWRRDQMRLQLASTPPTINPAVAGVSGPSPAQLRLADLRRQLDATMLVYTDQHPNVIRLKSLIAQAEAEAAAGGSGPGALTTPNPVYTQLTAELDNLELTLRDLEQRIALAQGEIERIAETANLAPEVEADLRRITRDYEVMQQQYSELIQRRESVLLAKRLEAETNSIEFRIVDPPVVPLAPSGPPHGLFMAGVLLLGLGAGVAFALLRVQLSDRIVSVTQLKETFGLPVLGSISVVRSAFHSNFRLAEGAALGTAAVSLLIAFGIVFYAYQFSADKPDLPDLAESLRARLGAMIAS
jgi:polysaccharide chain length determinant protein (PEP-CTERM system associated)